MAERPMVASRALREALGGLEPERLAGEDCATLAEDLARTEKACAAPERLAARAAVCGAPVPVGVARRVAEEAAIKAVIHDGVRMSARPRRTDRRGCGAAAGTGGRESRREHAVGGGAKRVTEGT